MYTENPFGILTVQMGSLSPKHSQDAGPYLMVSEINVPLLEGGLIYRGMLTSSAADEAASDVAWAMDLSTHVGRSVLESAQVRPITEPRQNPTDYWVRLGYPPSDFPLEGTYTQKYDGRPQEEITTEAYLMRVRTFPEDSRQLSGTMFPQTPGHSGVNPRFVYKDIRDLGFGAIVVIASGIAATLCAGALVTGFFANRKCTKVDVSYNFRFNLFGPPEQGATHKTGCKVTCIEDA